LHAYWTTTTAITIEKRARGNPQQDDRHSKPLATGGEWKGTEFARWHYPAGKQQECYNRRGCGGIKQFT
jgi:hypothetical protein